MSTYGQMRIAPVDLQRYLPVTGSGVLTELERLAARWRGARILHLTSRPFGTRSAALLDGLVPILRSLGVDAEWWAARGWQAYYRLDDMLSRAFAEGRARWTPELRNAWAELASLGEPLATRHFDFVVVHDAQPLPAIMQLAKGPARSAIWVWACHFDLRTLTDEVWSAVREQLAPYRATIIQFPELVRADMPTAVITLRPAIDPLGLQNVELSASLMGSLLKSLGIDPQRPLLVEVALLEERSDLPSIVEIYRRCRARVPGLQLALVDASGSRTETYLRRAMRRVGNDPDVALLPSRLGVGAMEINALQRAAVTVQGRLYGGFSPPIADAQWKARPVVAGEARDGAHQVLDSQTGLVAPNIASFIDSVVALLEDQQLAQRLGRAAREFVTHQSLITRYARDFLRVLQQLSTEKEIA